MILGDQDRVYGEKLCPPSPVHLSPNIASVVFEKQDGPVSDVSHFTPSLYHHVLALPLL